MERKLFGKTAHEQSGIRPARLLMLLLSASAWSACGGVGPAGDPEPTATSAGAPAAQEATASDSLRAEGHASKDARVRLGVDVLLDDSVRIVHGRRAGLITNHTGVSWPGGAPVSTIDRLAEEPSVDLVSLFSPEHGIRGGAEAGEKVASGVDEATGLPIHSLYGDTRKPEPSMLEDLDVLVFDIQDIGARYYTYVWTMALAMQAAGEAEIDFVVLDRPNPLGGRLVQGNVLEPEFSTFVGLYPVAMRHGLTAGELARLLVGELGVEVDLRVVPMEGWTRETWYDETGLPFIAPSPNMPSLASATHYPGTCLFEGTNLSVGRGTDRAFQQIGAPWLDADSVVARLNARELPGVRFQTTSFVPSRPGDRKYDGERLGGIQFVATDRERYDPTQAAVAALVEIQRLHPDRLEWHVSHFDRLAGTDRLRLGILAGRDLEALTASWPHQIAAFEAMRAPYLLYR